MSGDAGERLRKSVAQHVRKIVIHVGLWSLCMDDAVSIASVFPNVSMAEYKSRKLRVSCSCSCDDMLPGCALHLARTLRMARDSFTQ